MYIQAGDEHFFHGVLSSSQLFGVSVASSTVFLLLVIGPLFSVRALD